MNHVRCPQCRVPKAALWIGKPPATGCARDEDLTAYGLCASIHIELLQRALRRAVAPQCFDERGFIREGMLIAALDAERAALRAAAAVNGLMPVGEGDER